MIKAIFFDVDGTLISFQTHAVSPLVLEALQTLRNRGIKLFVSTGRHQAMLSGLTDLFAFDGYITLSGQYCTCGDTILRRVPLTREAVDELVSATEKSRFPSMFLGEDELFVSRTDEDVVDFVKELHIDMPKVLPFRHALDGDLFQAVTFLDKEHEHLLLDHAPNLKTTRWHPRFLDVIPTSGGKDLGVDAMLAHFGIAKEDCMAFGDGENDLSMLLHVGIGVAMGSASDEVKRQADFVTASVDEEGIPKALCHFGLI